MSHETGFSEGDKAIIEETAWRVGKCIAAEVKADTQTQLRLHVAECPLAKQATFLAGGWRALAAVGGGLLAVVLGGLELWKALH